MVDELVEWMIVDYTTQWKWIVVFKTSVWLMISWDLIMTIGDHMWISLINDGELDDE